MWLLGCATREKIDVTLKIKMLFRKRSPKHDYICSFVNWHTFAEKISESYLIIKK